MRDLIWTTRARADLSAVEDDISERHPEAAARIVGLIAHAAERLAIFPLVHRPGRVPGTREAVIHPNDPIVYRVEAMAVRILAILHARQRYP